MNKRVSINFQYPRSGYAIEVGPDLLAASGKWAKQSLDEKVGKAALVSNPKVFGLFGKTVENSLKRAGFDVFVCLIGDGERFKSFKTLQKTLDIFSENRLSRTDVVIALGGGVVGDLAGFAASIYLRGVAFLQMPTTLLSMIDSSVGGKTGVNSSYGKNLIGAFYQPKGVLVDVQTLKTLPKRELTAGFCEAIKQGAIANRQLFDQTAVFLDTFQPRSFVRLFDDDDDLVRSLISLLREQIAFKAKIVANDERESPDKIDAKSRKILNFGHTFAHALEKVTNYRYLKHGEAVGYGICFAAELSKKLGLLSPNKVNLLNDVVHRAGVLPPISSIDPRIIFETFKFDKKLVNNSLQWILLKDVGKPVIFPHSDVPQSALMSAFKNITRS
ncbi:MAG: 3-dehydroquinate synthase [Pyrinomonadaceae bacterium]